MSKMIIFNCPAYKGLTRDIPDWLDNTNCGQYTGQVSCQDCTNCIIKQIVELCKHDIEQWKAVLNGNILEGCVSNKILKFLDIQEVE